VRSEHSSSERRAFHTTGTWVTEASRTTTSSTGITSGQCLLRQIWSCPETMFIVTVSGETCQVQATVVRVCRLSMIVMSDPPIGAATVGVM